MCSQNFHTLGISMDRRKRYQMMMALDPNQSSHATARAGHDEYISAQGRLKGSDRPDHKTMLQKVWTIRVVGYLVQFVDIGFS